MKDLKKLVAVRASKIALATCVLCFLSFAPPARAKENKNFGMAIETVEAPVVLRSGDELQDARTNPLNLSIGVNKEQGIELGPNSKPQRFPEVENKTVRIVIDAGHGGRDLGAQGLNGTSEKEICLKVSRMVRKELQRVQKLTDFPLEVILSRDTDEYISLHDRVRIANEWGADLFISIHANSSPVPKVHGFEVYFLSPEATDEEASKLARLENQAPPTPISAQVISILSDATTQVHVAESSRLAEVMFSAVSRKIISSGRGVRQAPFTVLHGTNMPAVLVEMGYVTHQEESKNLLKETYLKRIANAISAGIIDFASKRRKL